MVMSKSEHAQYKYGKWLYNAEFFLLAGKFHANNVKKGRSFTYIHKSLIPVIGLTCCLAG